MTPPARTALARAFKLGTIAFALLLAALALVAADLYGYHRSKLSGASSALPVGDESAPYTHHDTIIFFPLSIWQILVLCIFVWAALVLFAVLWLRARR